MIKMISFKEKGDLKKTTMFLEKCLEPFNMGVLDKYGRMGVEALRAASPIDSGRMAHSWYYTIEHTDSGVKLIWSNSDIEGGYNVAILVQYGHGSKSGRYVPGRDFINPAMAPIFEQLKDRLLKEV